MPLLDELRVYNHSIGSYNKSMLTDSFEYSVKLSNGLIRLPMELVDDYEKVPGGIRPDRFKSAALNFASSNPAILSPPVPDAPLPHEQIEEKNNNILLKIIIAVVIVLIILIAIFLINQTQQRDIDNAARLKQEKLDSANTARLNQEKVIEAAKTVVRNNIRSYVTATSSTYNYRRIGGISNLKITVANNSNYALENVLVRVAYIKQDGGIYKYEVMNFNNISPHYTLTMDAPDSDRGTHIQYEIEKISSNQLGLY